MKNLQDIVSKIKSNLEKDMSLYFNVYSINGEIIKIRTGNHSANRQNNGDEKTLSFVSKSTQQRKSAYNKMVNEWEVDEDGYTDTSQSIEEVLEWEDVADDQEEAYNIYFENI